VKGISTYVPFLRFKKNNSYCKKIATSPFKSLTYHRIAENYILHPRNLEHLTLILEISIKNKQTIHKRSIPSIVHEKVIPITPKGPKILEEVFHNGEE